MSSASSSASSSPPPRVKRKRVSEDHDDEVETPEVGLVPEGIALSHAERRRQKKKDKKAQEQPSKKRKLADGTVADVSPKDAEPPGKGKQKRQNSVWVGNLWYKTTLDALRDFFDGVGEITRIHMPTRKGTKEEIMGFAYVDFATLDAKVTAIALSERELHGRNLLIKDGDDFTGRPASKPGQGTLDDSKEPSADNSASSLTKTQQKILRVQKQPPAPTLFLGNLGFDTTEDSIRELFEAHRHPQKAGKGIQVVDDAEVNVGGDGASKDNWIRKIRMGTFEDSGACKGFAFVDFTSIEHATAALINHRNHRLNGRDLVVEYASADAVRRGGGLKIANHEHKGSPGERHIGRQRDAGRQPQSHLRQRVHNEDEKEDRTKPSDAESSRRRNFKEAPSHTKVDRSRSRPKPGAALARAPRESAAIIPSQNQKIVF